MDVHVHPEKHPGCNKIIAPAVAARFDLWTTEDAPFAQASPGYRPCGSLLAAASMRHWWQVQAQLRPRADARLQRRQWPLMLARIRSAPEAAREQRRAQKMRLAG